MEDQIFKVLSGYGLTIGFLLFALYTGIKKAKEFFKDSKDKKESSSNITVNVSSNDNDKNYITKFKGSKDDLNYWILISLEQGKIYRAMSELRGEVLKEQMDYFCKHIQTFQISATNIMLELLSEVGIDECNYYTYFSNFENFIEVCENRLTNAFRRMCKTNGFSEYSPIEFKELIDKNINIIIGDFSDLLRKRYPQREYIKNFDKVYKLKTLLKDSLKDSFEYARNVAIEKEVKVKIAKENFENQISEIIGMRYTLEI